MTHSLSIPTQSRKRHSAFTMVELIVTMAVLLLLIALIAQLFNSAQAVTGMGNKHMDADSQARAVFDRMAIDFAQMVKRSDVDCFLKDTTNTFLNGSASNPAGNDQIAFFSQVAGYSQGSPGPVSLVSYRVYTDGTNAYLQRLSYGLLWNGDAADNASAPGNTPVVYLPIKIADKWPNAVSNTLTDNNYELAGPQIFRMEYYYVLKGQTVAGTYYPSVLSHIPWDKRNPGPNHTAVNGLRDVAAIGVVIAVADAKSQVLINNGALMQLAQNMSDFPQTVASGNNTAGPGDLEAQWQQAIDASNYIPRIAASGIRIYRRWFYLSSSSALNP